MERLSSVLQMVRFGLDSANPRFRTIHGSHESTGLHDSHGSIRSKIRSKFDPVCTGPHVFFFLLKKWVKLLKKIQQFKRFWGGLVQVHTVLVRVHTVLVRFTRFCSIPFGFVMVRLPRSTGQDPSGSSGKNRSKTDRKSVV